MFKLGQTARLGRRLEGAACLGLTSSLTLHGHEQHAELQSLWPKNLDCLLAALAILAFLVWNIWRDWK